MFSPPLTSSAALRGFIASRVFWLGRKVFLNKDDFSGEGGAFFSGHENTWANTYCLVLFQARIDDALEYCMHSSLVNEATSNVPTVHFLAPTNSTPCFACVIPFWPRSKPNIEACRYIWSMLHVTILMNTTRKEPNSVSYRSAPRVALSWVARGGTGWRCERSVTLTTSSDGWLRSPETWFVMAELPPTMLTRLLPRPCRSWTWSPNISARRRAAR